MCQMLGCTRASDNNFLSSLSINKFAYAGAILVPIAVPNFWTQWFSLNSKLLLLSTSSAKSTIASVGNS